MWQVLLAAAVAGSGYCVNRLLDFNNTTPEPSQQADHIYAENSLNPHFSLSSPSDFSSHSKPCEESIFRFNSASGSPGGNGYVSKKKMGSGSRGIRRTEEGIMDVDDEQVEKKCGVLKGGREGFLVDQKKIGKRFGICLRKKRRTGKNTSAKCESCTPKGDSSFALGLGAGLMYMMSAGKSEIIRLNKAVDETSKVVQELKTEISNRRSIRNLDILKLRAEENASTRKSRGDEGECGSSGLTEELQPEILMDQLEAELESELQKLPWCTIEDPGSERSSDFIETENSAGEFDRQVDLNLKTYQHNGVAPSELDKKLCHVLLEQQESQIVELHSELQQSHSKLKEKEAELQSLKDCIRRLTKVSLAYASDEETESQGQDKGGLVHNIMEPESKLVVGIKRSMDYESDSYNCCTK